MKAGQNALAVMTPPLTAPVETSRMIAPTEMPSDNESCCATLRQRGRAAHTLFGTSAIVRALMLVN